MIENQGDEVMIENQGDEALSKAAASRLVI